MSKLESIIQELVSKNSWEQLLVKLEDYELEAATSNQGEKPFFAIQLLAYLIIGDLDNARFLWRRIPKELKNNEIEGVWQIGRQMWKRNFSDIYKAIKSFKATNELYKTLIERLSDSFKERTFNLLSSAYTSIGVDDAATYLGSNPADVVKYATSRGWVFKDKLLYPKPIVEKKVQTADLNHLQSLTEYVVYLEN
eukprot:TRINITY_DN1149_c0_g3_i1.p1 TRINITY_DN1149_c0_g3~~TRINITY_DN1149_c0_g3_i1.p1  ORF type:complete len:195 (-),score=33.68 TRINITY_DN1149_c0_g3_i1:96-680(-)